MGDRARARSSGGNGAGFAPQQSADAPQPSKDRCGPGAWRRSDMP
jgi:hypothetical protein